MIKYAFLIAVLLPVVFATAQNVGVGTTSPKNKLHVAGGLRVDTLANNGDKGLLQHDQNGAVSSLEFTGNANEVLKGDGTFGSISGSGGTMGLFQNLTTEQRDAIVSPPNGLHIFNTDDHCLNFYDAAFQVWNSYCDNGNKVITIKISQDILGGIDFYNTYAKNHPNAREFSVIIDPGVNVVSGGYATSAFVGGTIPLAAISFFAMPVGTQFAIKIVNRGNIVGNGGAGGFGARGQNTESCVANAGNGDQGGVAILTTPDVKITIENYGIISGGGGGGGGGGRNNLGEYGGGGGGGATFGPGGIGGGPTTYLSLGGLPGSCLTSSVAQNGSAGGITTGSDGGAGALNGGNGGKGGELAQAGQSGSGTNAGLGGPAGLTVLSYNGGSGIIINNHGGQVLGIVQ